MGLLSAIIGAKIDRRDGDSGVKGALIGAASSKLISALPKLAAAAAIGWGVQKAFKVANRRKPANG